MYIPNIRGLICLFTNLKDSATGVKGSAGIFLVGTTTKEPLEDSIGPSIVLRDKFHQAPRQVEGTVEKEGRGLPTVNFPDFPTHFPPPHRVPSSPISQTARGAMQFPETIYTLQKYCTF